MTSRRFQLSAAAAALAFASTALAAPPSYTVEVIGVDLVGLSMNGNGIVAGRAMLSPTHGVAFVAKPSEGVQLLPMPPEWTSSDAYSINDNGTIVGAVSMDDLADTGSHAAAWYSGGADYFFWPLGALEGHEFSTALAVNNLEDVVGASGGAGLGQYTNSVLFWNSQIIDLAGFPLPVDVSDERRVLSGNRLLDLESMTTTTIPLPPGGWTGAVSTDVNNVGDFCGRLVAAPGCDARPAVHDATNGWTFLGECAEHTGAVAMNDRGDVLVHVAGAPSIVVYENDVPRTVESVIAPQEGSWSIVGVAAINAHRQILCTGLASGVGPPLLLRLHPIIGDLDGDGDVDGADLGSLLGEWGYCPGCDADFNGNEVVEGDDLGALLGAWS